MVVSAQFNGEVTIGQQEVLAALPETILQIDSDRRIKNVADKTAHLEMIQNVVNRLSQNSFLLKGWTVVLISGLLALGAVGSESLFVYLAFFPVLAFWWLDAYFLREERQFRALFDRVRKLEEADIDFSMDTSKVSSKSEL